MWRRKKKKPPPRGVWRLEGYAIWHPRRFGGTGFGCRAENALSTILFRGTGRKPWRLAWHLPRCVPCSHGRDRPPAPRARSLASPSAPGGRGSHATAPDAASSAKSICVGSIVIPARRSKASSRSYRVSDARPSVSNSPHCPQRSARLALLPDLRWA